MADEEYLITLAKPDSDMAGVEVDGKFHKFSESGYSFKTKDAGKAREIDEAEGIKSGKGNVIVSKVAQKHNYFFPIKKKKLKKNGKSKYDWVEVSPGKYKMVKKDDVHAE